MCVCLSIIIDLIVTLLFISLINSCIINDSWTFTLGIRLHTLYYGYILNHVYLHYQLFETELSELLKKKGFLGNNMHSDIVDTFISLTTQYYVDFLWR